MGTPLEKDVVVTLVEAKVKAFVSIGSFEASELVDELCRRDLITAKESEALRLGQSLEDHFKEAYADQLHDEDDPRVSEAVDVKALGEFRSAILAGNLSEAVLQASRVLPELADLQHLAERRGVIRHGA